MFTDLGEIMFMCKEELKAQDICKYIFNELNLKKND